MFATCASLSFFFFYKILGIGGISLSQSSHRVSCVILKIEAKMIIMNKMFEG